MHTMNKRTGKFERCQHQVCHGGRSTDDSEKQTQTKDKRPNPPPPARYSEATAETQEVYCNSQRIIPRPSPPAGNSCRVSMPLFDFSNMSPKGGTHGLKVHPSRFHSCGREKQMQKKRECFGGARGLLKLNSKAQLESSTLATCLAQSSADKTAASTPATRRETKSPQ